MNQILKILALVCFSLSSCTKTRSGIEIDDGVDYLIEEVWLEDLGELHDLKAWLERSETNHVEFINRVDALKMYEKAKADFGIELHAIEDASDPAFKGWTQFVVAKISKETNIKELKTFLEDASSEIYLEIEFGEKWLSLDGKYTEDEYNPEYIKKP